MSILILAYALTSNFFQKVAILNIKASKLKKIIEKKKHL